MFSFRQKTARIIGAAAMLGTGLGLAQLATTSTAAHADPSFGTAKVLVGSDTIQDLGNAWAGASPTPFAAAGGGDRTVYAAPLHSSSATFGASVISYDAVNPQSQTADCIATRTGGGSFDRPNGSGAGRNALLAVVNGTNFGGNQGCGAVSGVTLASYLDASRSSSLSGTSGTALDYMPIASDYVQYVAWCGAGTPAADCTSAKQLSQADLQALYTAPKNGKLAAGTWGAPAVTASDLYACSIQTGSGTAGFFANRMGYAGSTAPTDLQSAIAAQNCTGLEENGLNGFVTKVASLPPATNKDIYVLAVSMGSEIAQHNGFGSDRSTQALTNPSAGGLTAPAGTTINFGVVNNLAPLPYDVTANTCKNFLNGNVSCWSPSGPNGTAIAPTNYGRLLFVVAPSNKVAGVFRDKALTDLFASGAASEVCQSTYTALADQYGFGQTYVNGTQTAAGGCGSIAFQRGG